uniref:Centromere protein M n=1 Tax=Leptobrachium leishanense TaxID=445787 RepID=A0A8C5LZT0_9ANUR
MADLRSFDKMPLLNAGAVLLLGGEESWRERLAQALLRDPRSFQVQIHMAPGLPLPTDPHRPRFDLLVLFISLHSPAGLTEALRDLSRMDPHFLLGRVCFVAAAGGARRPRALEEEAVRRLADTHCSPLLFLHTDSEEDVRCVARRLLQLLSVCAGLVPGVSALSLASFTWSSTGN